jgi:hypothetical protein
MPNRLASAAPLSGGFHIGNCIGKHMKLGNGAVKAKIFNIRPTGQ